jgi:hypothetical protein
MIHEFLQRLDAYGLEHPRLTALATILLAVVVTVILLSQSKSAGILYEAF